MIWGRKCLHLKSSNHLACHKENWELLWPWHIRILSRGIKSFKGFFYPVKEAELDMRAGSWRQTWIRKKNQIFTLWFHYPSEMADLHVLMPSRMTALLDKHNLVVRLMPCDVQDRTVLCCCSSCPMLMSGSQALLIYRGTACLFCVPVL